MAENTISTESPVSINWRMTDPNGIDAQITMRAVKADTIEDALDIFDMRKQVVESLLAEGWTVAAPYGRGSTGGNGPVDPNAPKCAHGQRIKKDGKSKKTGKPYTAYFCPLQDKDAQCDPEWAN